MDLQGSAGVGLRALYKNNGFTHDVTLRQAAWTGEFGSPFKRLSYFLLIYLFIFGLLVCHCHAMDLGSQVLARPQGCSRRNGQFLNRYHDF